ncbi:MAG: putative toxin-antitoxin system toxin component, PIN family [Bacteroidales bacterium]|nr:putative toxin-antitoxin system toxin component, PIN family [Bacteroidales bacterium]
MMTERIVLDTNCLVQIVAKQAKYGYVWNDVLDGKITLCVTNEILFEYEEILTKFYGQKVARMVVEMILILPQTQKYDIYYHWTLVTEDPDDDKFVDCAVISNAKYLVSNDKHFNALSKISFPKIDVLKLAEFAERIK